MNSMISLTNGIITKKIPVSYFHFTEIYPLLCEATKSNSDHELMIPFQVSNKIMEDVTWIINQINNQLTGNSMIDHDKETYVTILSVFNFLSIMEKSTDELLTFFKNKQHLLPAMIHFYCHTQSMTYATASLKTFGKKSKEIEVAQLELSYETFPQEYYREAIDFILTHIPIKMCATHLMEKSLKRLETICKDNSDVIYAQKLSDLKPKIPNIQKQFMKDEIKRQRKLQPGLENTKYMHLAQRAWINKCSKSVQN